MPFTIFRTPKILFGQGSITLLGQETTILGSSALIVTGKSSMRESGVLKRLSEIFSSSGVHYKLFDQVEPEPSTETVHKGVRLAKELSIQVVIGIGGGSAIDVGKAVAIMATHEGSVENFQRGEVQFKKPGIPFIAIPTTAGTGAEITKNSVLLNKKEQLKKSIRDPLMIPKTAIIDPELTLTMPPDVTATSGMDALTQAIEALVSDNSNPICDSLSLEAIKIILRALKSAVGNPGDLDVRERMCLGSLLSAMSFANAGLGAVHGLAHPIGAYFGVPHGKICATLLPAIMEFNLTSRIHKYAQIGSFITSTEGKNQQELAKEALNAIKELSNVIGIPQTLSELGIEKTDLDFIVEQSINQSSYKMNPRKATKEEMVDVLRRIL